MPRYIDADALSERMYHDAFEIDSDMQRWDSGCWIRYKMFENAIENAPTIEPERKKGKWMQISPEKIYECSECGQTVMTDDIEVYKFCHWCGIDMRG